MFQRAVQGKRRTGLGAAQNADALAPYRFRSFASHKPSRIAGIESSALIGITDLLGCYPATTMSGWRRPRFEPVLIFP